MPKEATTHLYYRKDRKAWFVRLRTPDRHHIHRRAGKTKAEAKRFEIALLERERARVSGAITLGEFLGQTYFNDLVLRVADSTYRDQSRQLLEASAALQAPMYEVTVVQAQRFLDDQLRAGRAIATAHRYRSALSRCWTGARRLELVTGNPWRDVELPREPRKPPRYLTEFELRALYNAIPATYRASVIFMGETGADVGDTRRMTWENITSDFRFATWVRKKTGMVVNCPLRRRARHALVLRHRARVTPIAGTARIFARGGIWTTPGRPLWRKAVELTNHPSLLRRHLRHVRASLLVQRGVPIPSVARWLGHTSVRMVLERYGHLAPTGEMEHALELSERADQSTRARRTRRTSNAT